MKTIKNGCGCGGNKNSGVSLYILPYSSCHRRKRTVNCRVKGRLKSINQPVGA